MAIVEISKLKLYGISTEKQKVLDALFETRMTELKEVEEIKNTSLFFNAQKFEDFETKKSRLKKGIKTIESKLEIFKKNETYDIKISANQFENIENEKDKLFEKLDTLEDLVDSAQNLKKQTINLENKIAQLKPFVKVKGSLNFFDTKSTTNAIGFLPQKNIKEFENFLKDFCFSTFEVSGEEGNIISVFSHNSESLAVFKKLTELGFVKSSFYFEYPAQKMILQYQNEIKKMEEEDLKISNQICDFKKYLSQMKILHDYFEFCLEKEEAENKFRGTGSTFVLEAYLAKENEKAVEEKLKETTDGIEFVFLKPSKSEMPPTITKNNKIVKQFEFVTNMYSAPNYRELDPNAVIAFFFSIFFGFIMADIGYGLVLMLLGFTLALKKKNTGSRSLMFVLAIGGIFSVGFGICFGSFFGADNSMWSVIPVAIFPNPVSDVITMLVACLVAGAVQIMVSFFLKGILLLKRKKVALAIFSGFVWDLFFVGLGLFLLNYAGLVSNNLIGTLGAIIAGASVAISVFGMFFCNKGFERFSKSFGAVYGIIGLFSDILSYARLFGLMLSGAIIASIVNQLALGFFNSIITIIVGCFIMAIGHGFNLAMGALGAYIHVARLQYIEFFSRFYEGEGELFRPFGSNFSYVNLV